MRKASSEREQKIREKIISDASQAPFNQYIGLEFIEMTPNYGKTRIKFREEVLNTYKTIHGGALLALADVSAGMTASMCGYYVTTVASSLNFLLPAKDTEYIYCECLKLKTGKHISVFDIRITDDKGNLLDSGEFSFFTSKTSVLEG